MTNQTSPAHNQMGFTLLETIIYVALFGILMSGVIAGIHPFLRGAGELTTRIIAEGESAFVLRKVHWALTSSITDSSHDVTFPAPGDTEDTLSIDGVHDYEFALDDGRITLTKDGGTAEPISSDRVTISDFSVTHDEINLSSDIPRSIEISFKANGVDMGPAKYYLHF